MSADSYPNFPHPEIKSQTFKFINVEFHNTLNEKETRDILIYSKNNEGWNDELTKIAIDHIDVNHPIDVASRNLCLDLLNKFEKSKKKVVLEIGCSNGYLIDEFEKSKKYKYIGSDAIEEHIKKLKILHPSKPFLIFDILKNPFSEQMCNAIVMLNVLEHIKDDFAALKEANKLLKEDGILILEVPSGKMLYDQYDRELLHYRRYNMNELIKKIEDSGFIIEKKTHLGFIIFPIFALVKLFNKIFKSKKVVVKQAKFSDNFILRFFFKIEEKLQNFNLPYGIRCYVCARKKNPGK